MVGITKESIENANFVDKQWKNPKKIGFIKKIAKENKIVFFLFSTVAVFMTVNATLIYSFYKLLIKL